MIQTVSSFRSTSQLHLPVSVANPSVPCWMDVNSFPFSSNDIERIVRSSFGEWEAVETSYLRFGEQGTGTFRGDISDGRNAILYDLDGSDLQIPQGTGIIAITRTYWDGSGNITEADIVFNGQEIDFSVNASSTPRGQVDLQNTMTHEIGHFLGLDHSGLVGPSAQRPTMNTFNDPNGPREARSLEADDRAGISVIYPSAAASSLGRLSGRVTRPDGSGGFGVHVVAYRANTSTFVASTLTGATEDGAYEIGGLPAGDYQLRIEPLSGAVDYESFGGIYNSRFDIAFSPEYYDNAVSQQDAPVLALTAGQRMAGLDFVIGPFGSQHPIIALVDVPVSSPDETGTYPVRVLVTDDGEIASVTVHYTVDDGIERSLVMRQTSSEFSAELPGQSAATSIAYRITATDDEGLVSSYPESGTNRFTIIAFSGEPVLYVALRNENAIAVIDTGPSVEVARIPVGNTPLSVVLTSDGHHLFVANSGANDGTTGEGVWAIDTRTHRVVSKIETGAGPLDMDLSADGRSLYVTNSKEGSVSILSTLNHVVLRTLPDITFGAGPYGIVDTPDGRLWVTDLNANALLQVDSQTGSVLATTQVVASPRSLAVSPSGDRIYVAGFQGDISVVSPSSGDVILTYDTGTVDRIFRVVVSPSGDRVYASDTENARLLVFETDRLAHSIAASPGSENARDIGVSSDGKWVFLSNQDSDEIVTIEAASGTVASILNVPGGPRGIAVRSAPLGISFDVNVATQSDFDGNGEVAFTDFLLFAGAFGASSTDAVYDQRFDLDADFQVGFSDFLIFAAVFGRL